MARAASRRSGSAGQFPPRNRKELPPAEALAIADHQPLGKAPTPRLAASTDARRASREMGRGPTATRHKEDILPTRTFDGAGTHQAPRGGQEENLEQQGRGLGWCTPLLIAKTVLKLAEIPLMVNHITEGLFTGAR